MIIYPAMDLCGGKAVKLSADGHRDVEKEYGAAVEVADRWISLGASWLHVVDLDAALGKGTNLRTLRALLSRAGAAGVKVQFGGGVRGDETINGLVWEGCDPPCPSRLIVGTKAVADPDWLVRMAGRFPDRLMIAVDAVGTGIVVKGWQEKAGIDVVDLLRRTKDLPLAGYLYTNVAVEGRGAGVDWEPIKRVVEASAKPVIFSGGITTMDEVAGFKDLGAHGIIVGAALYAGRIEFTQARAVAEP